MGRKASSAVKFSEFSYRGLTIRYATRQGLPGSIPLLMFNGVGQSIEVFEPLLAEMPNVSMITLDVPGAGLSDVPKRPWRYCEHATLAAALLDELKVDKVNVFGVSWGGGLAQQFSHQFPERAQRLVLAASPPGNIMVPGNLKVYLRMANLRRFWNKDYMHDIAGDIYGGDIRTDRTCADELVAMLKAPTTKGYLYQVMTMYGWSSWWFLRKLKLPTLIIAGDDDPMIPMVNPRMMAKLIPNSTLEVVDCGHLFMLTRLQRTCSMIRDFAYA